MRIIIGLIMLLIIGLTGCIDYEPTPELTLLEHIQKGETIMVMDTHPDDAEIMCPGIFPITKNYNCKVYKVTVGAMNPEGQVAERMAAIAWLEDTYLERYIMLNYTPMLGGNYDWPSVKIDFINLIETHHPDVIITFSPLGWKNATMHSKTSQLISELNLSYNPKIFWFINKDQTIPYENFYEYASFPPDNVINMNSYWDDILEIWTHYSTSIHDLAVLLADQERLDSHDKYEYYKEAINVTYYGG